MIGMVMRHGNCLFAPFAALSLSGCGLVRGAPSFSLFGAFFPSWMLCAMLGILAAVGARALFVVTDWAEILPYQLFVCASLGLIFGLLTWLLWFGS
jgi:hypothetical protein